MDGAGRTGAGPGGAGPGGAGPGGEPGLFMIRRGGPGRLATMAKPSGGPRLPGQVRWLAGAGVDVVVSLLSEEEVAGAALAAEGPLLRGAGLKFLRLPVPDLQVPDRAASLDLAEELLRRLRQGAGVAVHCWAGVGRSSTLAAVVLVLDGLTPSDAWERISAARGRPVPETLAQRAFVDSLARQDRG